MDEVWDVPGYDVEAMLGFGATGEVWRARELATGDVVALKRLRPGADPVALELLRREATLLRRLDTPYVVRLRAVVGDVLVLDHAPGGSLASLLTRRGVLDPGEVVTIAAPLASALAVAHGLGMVHGDVTPANVLFTADGMPLLADLGVARAPGDDLAGVDGTAEYLDPAVAAGGDPDAAADVWALAAVCHHLLAGSPPHDGASVDDVLDAARAGRRAPLGLLAPSAPRALVAAVEAGLADDPAARPDAAAFCSLLRRAHATAPVRLTGGAAAYAPVRETHVVRGPVEVADGRPRRGWRGGAWGGRAGRGAGSHAATAVPRRRPAHLASVAALVAAVLLAAGVGWASGRGGVAGAAVIPALPGASPPPASSSPSSASPPGPAAPPGTSSPSSASPPGPAAEPSVETDWGAVLDQLDAARADAFARADPAALQQVWAPGSGGRAADADVVRRLEAAGQRAVGLRHQLRDVQVVQTSPTAARLRVVDVLAAHEVLDRDGTAVRRVAERGSTAWSVSLLHTGAGWRLVSVEPA